MKKSLLLIVMALAATLAVSADQLSGSGYYRVKNYKTGRYLYVLDNKAYEDVGATTVELKAVELRSGFENCESDPASVLYIKDMGNNQVDILAQGTGIYQLSNIYLKTRWDSGKKAYTVYGSRDGMTKYLGDAETWEDAEEFGEKVFLSDAASGDYRLWIVEKMSTADGRYFGAKPTVTANGEYWASMYTSFPYSAASTGVEIYYVYKVDKDKGVAVIRKFEGNKVSEATGALIKCVSPNPADNKLNVGDAPAQKVTDSRLDGVYFNNTQPRHENQRPFDGSWMRVFGMTKSGKPGFVMSKDKYLARNQAFLKVPTGCPDELELMTEEEYEVGVEGIAADATDASFDVYNLQGVRVAAGVSSTADLPAGIYVANGKKIVVR